VQQIYLSGQNKLGGFTMTGTLNKQYEFV